VPELPDICLYVEHLKRRVEGFRLERVRLASPFLLRSVDPAIAMLEGRRVEGMRLRTAPMEGEGGIGERTDGSGGIRFRERNAPDDGGKQEETRVAPRRCRGEGSGRLRPRRPRGARGEEATRLFAACRETLVEWTDRLRLESGEDFPAAATAFRPGMAVHGRFRKPCPVCGSPVQRIVYAENESNYCAVCQTGGRLLADRALSQLLHPDWPRTLEELESRRAARRPVEKR
jgi:Zinc finger found in FPG and IleRS